MKKIIRIARLELSLMFYSPIAWLILGIVFVQCAFVYTETLYDKETQQQLERPLTVLTRILFAGDSGVLPSIMEYMYLYIPLLTMGIFSREYQSGSIKLLQSSPVTIRQMVLGKYLSLMAYGFILILLLMVFIGFAYFSVESLDVGFIVCGFAALFLLICAYGAIGLYMSSLTAYQVVAAISTLAVLALLNYIGAVGQQYDWIRELTYWISISGRAENMVNGLITTRDLLYFVLVILLFLSFTMLGLSHERSNGNKFIKSARYLAVFAAVVVIGYLSSLPTTTVYFDTTRVKDRTLSVSGQEIAGRIRDSLKIINYTNVIDYKAAYGASQNRNADVRQFEQYQRFIPFMEMEYVAYYDSTESFGYDTTQTLVEKAKKSADALGFNFKRLYTPAQMKAYPWVAQEGNTFVRFVSYKGQMTPLRMYDDLMQYPKEPEISAALKRLLDGPARIGVVSGNGERSSKQMNEGGLKIIMNGPGQRGALYNQGFQLEQLDLGGGHHISDSLDAIVIADPQVPYTAQQVAKVKDYLDKGGNMLLLGDVKHHQVINPLMHLLGLTLEDGMLLQESENFELSLLQLHFDAAAADNGFKFYPKAKVVMNGASAIKVIEDKGFAITPLLYTDSATTWNKTGDIDLNKTKITFDPSKDTKAKLPVAMILTRDMGERTQKIMVSGDADYISNAEMSRFNISSVNAMFALRTFKWFTDGVYPVSGGREAGKDTVVKVSRRAINIQKILLIGLVPLVILGSGMYILRRRKRK